MCVARPRLLVLVAAVLRTEAAAAEAAVHKASNLLTSECRQEEDRQELTSVLQVDVQVGHRTDQAPTATKEAIPGEFEPRPVWFPVALLNINTSVDPGALFAMKTSVDTGVAGVSAGSSDGMLNSTGEKQLLETTSGASGDASVAVMIGLIAMAVMGACGLVMVRDRRTLDSRYERLGSVSRGSPGRTAAAGTMSKGFRSPDRSAGASAFQAGSPVVTTKTLPPAVMPPIVKKRGTGSPAPSPRTLAQMPIPRDSVPGRQVLLTDPKDWGNLEAYFTIQALQLSDVADSEATGTVDIMRHGVSEPTFVASVQPMDAAPRALMIATADQRGRPLCSCSPAGVLSGTSTTGFCSELEFRDSRGRPWGSLVPHGPDIYTIFKQGGREVLLVEGDQASGRLVVQLGDEVVAHAAMDNDCTQLEVGVKPHTDPILMLTSVLAVLIFNPEDPGHLSPEHSNL